MPKVQATEKTYLQRALNERGWSRSQFTALLNRLLPPEDVIPEQTVVRYCEGKMKPSMERRASIEELLRDHPVSGGLDLAYLWVDFVSQ